MTFEIDTTGGNREKRGRVSFAMSADPELYPNDPHTTGRNVADAISDHPKVNRAEYHIDTNEDGDPVVVVDWYTDPDVDLGDSEFRRIAETGRDAAMRVTLP